MKITICGSIAFYDEMLNKKRELEALGHTVLLPPSEVRGATGELIPVGEYYALRKAAGDDVAWIWDNKERAMRDHFVKVATADAVLILNCNKKDIAGYVGANTLLEMGLAFYLNKKIYLLTPIPFMDCREEILGMRPQVINGDINLIV
jgi:hypothetical protein